MRKFTKEKKAEAERLFREGLSLNKIEERLNVPRKSVANYFCEIGLRKPQKPKLSKDKCIEAAKLIKNGHSKRFAAKQFNSSSRALDNSMYSYGMGVKKTNRTIIDEDLISKMINLFEGGVGTTKIAKDFKIAQMTLSKILKDRGYEIKICKYSEDMGDKIQELYENSGLSMRVIAEKLKIEKKVIYRFKKERKLKRKVPYKDVRKKRLPWREGWIKEYGEEKGEAMWLDYKMRQRKNNEGKNNSMYGKPSPMGSGYGIKGWHKGRFFRSLRELSFMLNYIDRFQLKEESLEKRKYRIPYVDPVGISRTYAGDFLINNKFFVEIKPRRLWESPSVQAKAEAGKEFCKNKGWKYKLIDPIVDNNKIVQEYLDGNIKFNEKSLEKFLEFNNLKSSPK
jgi:hypothetical protein